MIEPLEERRLLAGDLHAWLTIYVDSQRVDIPANIGLTSADVLLSDVHTEDDSGELIVESMSGGTVGDVTLGDFFQTWRTLGGAAGNNLSATFSSTELMGNLADVDSSVQMFVNGHVSTDYDSYVLQNNDEIVLAYGSNAVVSINTNFGPIVMELFSDAAPATVQNFLNYVNDGDYNNAIFHRLAYISQTQPFVLQGGGFATTSTTFTSTAQFTAIPTDDPVVNEPGISNTLGTVAMAKLGGDPNSATNQFFINLGDNSANLDNQNGGFTVFAQVLDLATVADIASLPVNTSNASPFGELPMSSTNQLVVIQSVEGAGWVRGTKFLDADADGVFDSGESGIAGATVYVDSNNNGQFDSGEISTVTDANGEYVFQLVQGPYTIRSVVTEGRTQTTPNVSAGHTVTVQIGIEEKNVNFGETAVGTLSVDLLAGVDTGTSSTDNITQYNNTSAAKALQFLVSGVTSGAEVRILADGIQIGSATAGASTVTVTTNGTTALSDGVRNITAVQVINGVASNPSVPLPVTIDATPPAAISNTPAATANVGHAYTFDAASTSEGESGVSYSLVNAPSGMTINAQTGLLSWTPTSSQAGTNAFEIRLTDTAGNFTSKSASVNALAAIPAAADAYSVNEDATLTVAVANGVLANDGGTAYGTLTAAVETQPSHGTLSLSPDGSFTYTPAANYYGTDTFTYSATDGSALSAPTTVTITVNNQPDPPTAVNDSFTALNDGSVQTLDVLANDSSLPDPSQTLTITAVTQGTAGGIVAIESNKIKYTAPLGFVGTDTFTYTIQDSDGLTDTALVTLAVDSANNSLSGYVYVDADNDGVRDAGEVGVPGVLITLTGTENSGTAVSRTAITDDAGSYSFTGLASGTYQLTEKQPEAMSDGLEATPLSGAVAGSDQITNIVLSGGQHAAENNFGERGLRAAFVSIRLFLASTPATDNYLAELIAQGEDMAGNSALAAAIRAGWTSLDGSSSFPVALADAYTTSVNTALTVGAASGVLANDTNSGSGTLTAAVATQPAHGTLSLNADGSFTYTPGSGYTGTDTFTYIAGNGVLTSNAATVTITIVANNQAPTAAADSYTATEDTALSVGAGTGVLANDTDPNGDTLTASVVTNPSHGTLSLAANGSFIYTPNANYSGTDSFTYRASDGSLTSGTATVTITVSPVNDAPVAVADSYNATRNTTLTVAAASGVLANDSDADADTLTATVVTQVSHGTLSLNSDGAFTYAPNTDYSGSDSFTYRASDGSLTSNTVTVTINVAAANAAPVGVADSYTANEDATLTITASYGVLSNDTDADGNTLSAVLVDTAAHGALSLNSDGSFVYTPNANYNGIDTFTYRASDGTATSSIVTVTITVVEVPDAPVATADTYRTAPGGVLTVDAASGVLANDADADGDTLTATVLQDVAHGTLSFQANGAFTYTPASGFRGTDSFTYEASDGSLQSSETTVTIEVNTLPVAQDDSYSMDEDEVLIVPVATGLLTNDSDADGDAIAAVLISGPSHGNITLNADGSFTYTPAADYFGVDTFRYAANDGLANSAEAVVTINIAGVNDAPVALDDTYQVAVNGTLTVSAAEGVLTNDYDRDGDTLTALVTNSPSHGNVTLYADGSFTYQPNAGYHGLDTFTYTASDGPELSPNTTVTIQVNTPPVAAADAYTVNNGNLLSVGVDNGLLANDSDGDGDPLTATLTSDVSHGTLELTYDGSFRYEPAPGFAGTDSFRYRAEDGIGSSAEVEVTITVVDINDAPVANPDTYRAEGGATLEVGAAEGVMANDYDYDDDEITVLLVTSTSHGILALASDGSFSYTPDAGYRGIDSFTYQLSDGISTSEITSVSIVVNATPVATPDVYQVQEGGSLNVDQESGVLANDSDADEDPLTVYVVQQPGHGSLTMDANGAFSYSPDQGFYGSDMFSYYVSDGSAHSDTVAVTIEVAANPALNARVEIVDVYGAPIDTIEAGTAFTANVYVRDVREAAQGVSAAYFDLLYNSALAGIEADIIYGTGFTGAQSGDTFSVAGLVDEVGATFVGSPDANEQLLFQVPMIANQAGILDFTLEAADVSPAHDCFLFGEADALALARIHFQGASLEISAAQADEALAETEDWLS